MKELLYRALWLATVLGLCACGSLDNRGKSVPVNPQANQWSRVSSNSTSNSDIKFFGFIDVTHEDDGSSQFFEAGFFEFDKTTPLSVLLDSFRQPEIDTCEYYEKKTSEPLDLHDDMELPGHPYRGVPAGRIIDISIKGRRYVKLKYIGADDPVQYETDTGSLPITFGGLTLGDALLKTTNLRAHASGETFPAFSDVPVPPVDRPKGFNLSINDSISAATQIRWRKGSHSTDEDLRVQIEAGGGGRAVFCAVADDGSFELPPSVTSLLGDRSIINPSIYRDAVHFYQSGDALLIVSQSSYY